MTTDARRLAAALAAEDDTALDKLFTDRIVSARATWRDFFDAAEALLEPASVANGIAQLSAAQAVKLQRLSSDAASSDPDQALISAALLTSDGTVYSSVARVVLERETLEDSLDAVVADDEPAARAAERAFTTIGHIADLLAILLATPLAQIGTGAVSAADRRRLADAGIVDDADDVGTLLRVAETAGLALSQERKWMATSLGASWLSVSNLKRWERIATAVVAGLPSGLRAPEGQIIPTASWNGAYPWNPQWRARVAVIKSALSLLGLISPAGAPTPWAKPLFEGGEPDIAMLAELLPHEVNHIYLQNDLTAISPGPLDAALDIRLRSMSVRESHAQASTYRFTPSSLMDAVTGGETEETISEFLEQISLTGIPQPLAYLVGESARRHGSIRVGSESGTDRTLVTAETATLIDTMSVDQTLRPLGFMRSPEGLVSRVGRDVVAIALADAHYPVTLVAADGTPERLQRQRIADETAPAAPAYEELIRSLRVVATDDTDAAWLERELEAAVRLRSTLLVTVSMPGAQERTFTLEAAGLGGGRLRGRDKAADVERTVPLSHITRIEAAR